MSDTIRRDDVLKAFNRLCGICGKKTENNGAMCRACSLDDAIDIVEDIPTAEPKVGKWVENETTYADNVRQTCDCSDCGKRSPRPLGDYCRWCGAKMEMSE